jgi:hypothetical protein
MKTTGPFNPRTKTMTATQVSAGAPSTAATTHIINSSGFKPRPGSVIDTVVGK